MPRINPRNNRLTTIQFLDHVIEKLPFQIEVVETDNGSEFHSKFHWHVLDRGIRHVYDRREHQRPRCHHSPSAVQWGS